MKVEYLNKEGKFLLTCQDGQSFKISAGDFWETCRIGAQIDARSEIEEYLDEIEEVDGVAGEAILGSEGFCKDVIEQLITARYSKESFGDIDDAIRHCLETSEYKDEVCGKVVDDLLADGEERSCASQGDRMEDKGLYFK